MITAGPRLDFLVSLVPSCGTLCDVGTDHAYLPVMAISQGRVKKPLPAILGKAPAKRHGKQFTAITWKM